MEDRTDPHRKKKKTQNKPTNERTQNAKRRKRARASSLAQSEPSLCVHNSHEPRSEPTSKPRKLSMVHDLVFAEPTCYRGSKF